MKKNTIVSVGETKKIAALANLQLSNEQITKFSAQLSSVLDYISSIQSLDTTGVAETSQVTGLTNVFREDVVDETRMLTQEQALSNAKRTHNGFFFVDAIFK